jgi:hypothetical protein
LSQALAIRRPSRLSACCFNVSARGAKGTVGTGVFTADTLEESETHRKS